MSYLLPNEMKTLTLIFAFFLACLATSSPLAMLCLTPISLLLVLYANQYEFSEDPPTLLLWFSLIPMLTGLIVLYYIL